MKFYLERIIIVNRAPFKNLDIPFDENQIAVLTALNGGGKTTILSHIADAFFEMTKKHFVDVSEDPAKFYRVSSPIFNLDSSKPSFVYLRFRSDNDFFDYVDIRNNCTKDDYDNAVKLENKIDFDSQIKQTLTQASCIKATSPNFTKEVAEKVFKNNVNVYFPSYRFEMPGYLNDPQKDKLKFRTGGTFSGYLGKPIEVVSGVNGIANWLMDIVLDFHQYKNIEETHSFQVLYWSVCSVVTQLLEHKNQGQLQIGIGHRNDGASRVLIMRQDKQTIYPSIFNLSSGEAALICIFAEILRHADINQQTQLDKITGIVLIDEVDKHLHIKLQKEVLPALLQLFPKVQFILSSHSPFLSMGLADLAKDRTKIINIESGLAIQPEHDEQYQQVYEMMIRENERFKSLYESIKDEINDQNLLYIITEGKNTRHIAKAIDSLAPELKEKIKIVKGAEGKTGTQQLKNAYEILIHSGIPNTCLFIWDVDFVGSVNQLRETGLCKKFCFEFNTSNEIAKKGIENLYSSTLFTNEVYSEKTETKDYGGENKSKDFDKNKFLEKIESQTDVEVFSNFNTLIAKIKSITDAPQDAAVE